MLERGESSGTPQDLLQAIACAVLQFSAIPQAECRDLLGAELRDWLSTAREPRLGDRELPQSAW